MPNATLRARMGVTAATLLTSLGLAMTPALATSAHATPGHVTARSAHSHRGHHRGQTQHLRMRRNGRLTRHGRNVMHRDRLVHKVLNEARKQKGKPYVYGADGPHAFDCSGLVRFVFGHSVHRWLPHNAAEQYHALHHISRRNLRVGDLVFTDNGSISHVGIYAGDHHWWVAPHTGARVHKQRIYHAHFVYARVLMLNHNH